MQQTGCVDQFYCFFFSLRIFGVCVCVYVSVILRWPHSDCEPPSGNPPCGPLHPHMCVGLCCFAICWSNVRPHGDSSSSEFAFGWSCGLSSDHCLKKRYCKKKQCLKLPMCRCHVNLHQNMNRWTNRHTGYRKKGQGAMGPARIKSPVIYNLWKLGQH